MSPSEIPATGLLNEPPSMRFRRTAMACLNCRERKSKCSGEHPICQRCALRGIPCEYPERRNSNKHSTTNRPSSQRFPRPSRSLGLNPTSQRTTTHSHHSGTLETKRASLASQDISFEMSPFYDPSFSLAQLAPPSPTLDGVTSIPDIDEANYPQLAFENTFYYQPTLSSGTMPYAGPNHYPIATSQHPPVFSWSSLR